MTWFKIDRRIPPLGEELLFVYKGYVIIGQMQDCDQGLTVFTGKGLFTGSAE